MPSFLWVQPIMEGVTLQSWAVEFPFQSEDVWCLTVNASLFSDIPKITEVFPLAGLFLVEVVLGFCTWKSTKQFLKSKLLGEIFTFF